VNGCAVAPDGRRIVSAASDNTLRIWDAETGTCLRVLEGHTRSVNGCAVAPDGRRIVSAADDNTLRIWDAETGTCLRVLEGHTRSVNGCAVAPDGRRIVSAASDNTLRIWDAETGEEAAFRVHLLPDGEYVSLTPQSDRVLHASPEAWRSLGCLAPGPDGKTIRYPAEIFGELPP
jgi:WD40 repeat protein